MNTYSRYTPNPISGGGLKSLNNESGDVNLVAGDNITITAEGQNITISAAGGGGGSAIINQIEVDFGILPTEDAIFLINDPNVTPISHIIGQIAFDAPNGKDQDELTMDSFQLLFSAGAGQFTLFIKGLEGYLADKFKINYQVG